MGETHNRESFLPLHSGREISSSAVVIKIDESIIQSGNSRARISNSVSIKISSNHRVNWRLVRLGDETIWQRKLCKIQINRWLEAQNSRTLLTQMQHFPLPNNLRLREPNEIALLKLLISFWPFPKTFQFCGISLPLKDNPKVIYGPLTSLDAQRNCRIRIFQKRPIEQLQRRRWISKCNRKLIDRRHKPSQTSAKSITRSRSTITAHRLPLSSPNSFVFLPNYKSSSTVEAKNGRELKDHMARLRLIEVLHKWVRIRNVHSNIASTARRFVVISFIPFT